MSAGGDFAASAADRRVVAGRAAMEALGRELADLCPAGTVIALSGELGAGKTTLVRGLAAGLGLDPAAVASPTFVLLQLHGEDDEDGPRLAHLDAWRIDDPAELAELGWEDLLDEGAAVVAVEWPERIVGALPERRIDVVIEHGPDEGERTVRIARRG